MQNFIKRLPWGVELILVITVGLGHFIYYSTLYAQAIVADVYDPSSYEVTDWGNYYIIIYEIVAFLMIVGFLKIRGWSYKDFNLEFKWKLLLVALLLFFICNFISNSAIQLIEVLGLIEKNSAVKMIGSSSADWISILAILVINSFYEEFILIGYLFKRLENYNPVLLIGLSIVLRESFHTYQGWISLISIIPIGLVFGYYYYKFKKLWPIIITHGLFNLFYFLNEYYQWVN